MIEVDTVVGTGMKATCARDELLRHLGIVSRAVSTRMTVQILSGIRLSAAEGRLELAATDMELSLRSGFEAEIGDEGVVVVPGKTFVDIVRLLPDADVALEHKPEEGSLVLTCGSATYRLHTYNPEDFRSCPTCRRCSSSQWTARRCSRPQRVSVEPLRVTSRDRCSRASSCASIRASSRWPRPTRTGWR